MTESMGRQLKMLREKHDISRHCVEMYLHMKSGELANFESGFVEPDESICEGYLQCIDYVRANSLPDKSPYRMIWTTPPMSATTTSKKRESS